MELLRALGTFCWPPDDQQAALASVLDLPCPTPSAWHATFVERYYPYGSVYLGGQGFVGGEVRDAVAGVLRALEAEPPEEADHLGVLLDAYATVDANGWAPARTALLWEHLLPWALPFADRIRTDDGPYQGWAQLLFDALSTVAGQVPPPAGLPPSLRVAPSLPDPRDGTDHDLVAALLTPVRLGAILTRDDLTHAARDLDLGGRVAERRYVLRGLLAEDPAGVLGWLAGHCRVAAARPHMWPPAAGHLAAFWRDRAQTSAGLLDALADEAQTHVAAAMG